MTSATTAAAPSAAPSTPTRASSGMSNALQVATRRACRQRVNATPSTAPPAGEDETFGERLTNQPPARRAEREPHGELSAARRHARELKAREVRATISITAATANARTNSAGRTWPFTCSSSEQHLRPERVALAEIRP